MFQLYFQHQTETTVALKYQKYCQPDLLIHWTHYKVTPDTIQCDKLIFLYLTSQLTLWSYIF